MNEYKIYDENDEFLQNYREWRMKNGNIRKNIEGLHGNVKFVATLLKRNYSIYKYGINNFSIDVEEIEKKLYTLDTNTLFAEPIFKTGLSIGTGYITEEAIKAYSLGLEKDKTDGVTLEHWFPRTHVGRILISAAHGRDLDNIFDGEVTDEKVYDFIDKYTPMFCSVIISTKKENNFIDTVVKQHDFGFDDYVNFNHYKLANFKIFRWVGFPDRGRRTTTSVFPLKDFSYYYPEIITDGMRELESLSRKENINV
jgi:hypothetical protein